MDATRRVTAVLGPTNTGKTHHAIERMLAHRTGVIGLPLRLLAREVYDRIVAKVGPSVVALVTAVTGSVLIASSIGGSSPASHQDDATPSCCRGRSSGRRATAG